MESPAPRCINCQNFNGCQGANGICRMRIRFFSALGCLGLLAAFHTPAAFSKEVTPSDFIKSVYQTLLKYEEEFKSSGYIRGSCEDARIANSKGVSLLGYDATKTRFEMYLSAARNQYKNDKDATEGYYRYLADIQTAAFSRALMAECPKVW